MTLVGNVFLMAAALVVAGLVGAAYGKPPPQSGDAAVGYPWGIIMLNSILLGLLTVVVGIVAWKGAVPWVSEHRGVQFTVLLLTLAACVVTSALGGLFKYERGPVPGFMRALSQFTPGVVPVLLVVVAGILLNDGWRTRLPVGMVQAACLGVSLLGLLGVAAGLHTWAVSANATVAARRTAAVEFEDRNHRRMLDEIEHCDVSRNLIRLLVFTGGNQDPEIQERAVARFKSNPAWQAELLRWLAGDEAPEVFQYLAYNAVDDPALFVEPIRQGIRTQAADIRRTIRRASHPSHLYPGQFSYEVERVLRTVDRFTALGGDYREAMRELRAALGERADVPKPAFTCAEALDRWLKAHP